MHSTRHLLFAFGSTALFGVTLGACFTGKQAEGLPCTANSHCGPTLECIDGFCGGVVVCGDGSTVEAALACDGGNDCEDGSDEDSAICGTDMFFCADESTVPLESTCDGELDCEDGEDEAAAICVFDQCTDPQELFEMFDGPSDNAIDDPLGLFAGQFIGDSRTDMVLAQRNGSFVRILELQPGGPPTVTSLPGDNDDNDPTPNFLSPVQDVYTFDAESDGDTDLMVLTTDGKYFVYFSEPSGAPVQLTDGDIKYFELPEVVTVVDVALGKLDVDDTFVDSVSLTDQGFLFTVKADPVLGAMGMNPFVTEELPVQIDDGTAFTQVLLADLYGDTIDELLVVGFTDMPQLWILERVEGMVLDSWEVASQQPIPLAASEFAVGNFDDSPSLDIAFIERIQGRAAILRQGMPGVFMPSVQGPVLELGVDISGLAVRDFDCDGIDDLIFNVESPAALQVLFSNATAELSAVRSLTFASAGKPQGNLALMKFDDDDSWDVFQAVSKAGALDGPKFRSFVSSEPPDAPP